MFSDRNAEDLKNGAPNQSDDESFMLDGFVSQNTGTHKRTKMFAAVLVLVGVLAGAMVTASQRSTQHRVLEKNSELEQKWECVHWTPTDNMARRANANERRLCENKATLDSKNQYVYKPFGLTCQGGCHCCTRQRWSCTPWTKDDIRARESHADERMLCENKQATSSLNVYKYKPNGKTCGNGGGCLCCYRKIKSAACTALTAGSLDTSTCSRITVSAAAADVTGDYEPTTCAPNPFTLEAGTKIFSLNGNTACTQYLALEDGQNGWTLTNKNTPATWTATNYVTKTLMPATGGTWTAGGNNRVKPAFCCAVS